MNRLSFLLITALFLLIIPSNAISQSLNLPVEKSFSLYLQSILSQYEGNSSFHPAIKPFLISDVNTGELYDSAMAVLQNSALIPAKATKFIHPKYVGKNNQIEAYPLFSLSVAGDISSSHIIAETGAGAGISGFWGSKIGFSADLFAENSGFVSFVDSFIQRNEIIPGRGYAHRTSEGFASSFFSGYFSYSPSQNFNIQIGKDKHFWGDGYRSLLLSDVAYHYPFFKATASVWKIKYVYMIAQFQDIRNSGGETALFRNKYGAFHYLSWNATHWLSIGFFESIIWQASDSSGYRGVEVNYLNPVIFFRPVEFSLGSSDNALMGFSATASISKRHKIYLQLLIDEFLLSEVRAGRGWWGNKHGVQLGYRTNEIFNLKGLSFLAEFNYVRPFTYSHGISTQNYAHFNQPLAHPLGANFYEALTLINFQRKNWLFEAKAIFSEYGTDTGSSNWGGNIFLDYRTPVQQEYGNSVAQGVNNKVILIDLKISYLLIPSIGLLCEAGVTNRFRNVGVLSGETHFIYAGIRSALFNRYYE